MRFRRYELVNGAMEESPAGQWAENDDVEMWFRRYSLQCQHTDILRKQNQKLTEILSAIHMRCAGPDVVTEDGHTFRFVPPDPLLYWRELSGKVNTVLEEMTKATATDSD